MGSERIGQMSGRACMETDKIYNEDCLVGMRGIADKSVDAIISDLPYGVTRNKWDNVIPLEPMWNEFNRVIKDRGAVVLFSQMPFTAILAGSNLSMLKYEIVWRKSNSTGFLNSRHAPLRCHENILVFSKSCACNVADKEKAMVFNPQMEHGHMPYAAKRRVPRNSNWDVGSMKEVVTESGGERYPTDIVCFPNDKDTVHPTQKPVALLEWLVRTYTDEGGLVMDCCMGSGTTAVACVNTGRRFIGFETDVSMWNVACGRVEKAVREKKERLFNSE